jgi:hypothetical protein
MSSSDEFSNANPNGASNGADAAGSKRPTNGNGTSPKLERIVWILEERARGGDISDEMLIRALAKQVLHIPIARAESKGDTAARVSVALFEHVGSKVVFAFTSEDRFRSWSASAYECLPVLGADLAVTIPPSCGLIIDAGSKHMLNLPFVDAVAFSQVAAEQASDLPPPPPAKPSTVPEDSPLYEEDVLSELLKIFATHPDIVEAYYLTGFSPDTQAVLGLLVDKEDAEQRFLLISDIADVARRAFGYAGAIEVYDDLNVKTSSSWELFTTLTPIYVRPDRYSEDGAAIVSKDSV